MIPKFEKSFPWAIFVEHVETNPLFDQNSRLAIRLNFQFSAKISKTNLKKNSFLLIYRGRCDESIDV